MGVANGMEEHSDHSDGCGGQDEQSFSPSAGIRYDDSGASYYELWFKDVVAHHPMLKIVPATILAGLFSGIIAVIGAFFRPEGAWLVVLNIFFFSPFMEELFKQIGLIYLLEKRTWLLRFTWQFPLAGALSGITFSVLENLIYRYHHLAGMTGGDLTYVMGFRWIVCTALHLTCALIASAGLCHAWKRHMGHFQEFNLKDALWYFAAAIGLHGFYNFLVFLTFFDEIFHF